MQSYQLQRSIRLMSLLAGIGLATIPLGSAQASALMFVVSVKPPPTLMVAASAASQCVALTYDKNGNRLSQTVTPMTTNTSIWGTATYGCFVWKP